jgi:hypothetical protein
MKCCLILITSNHISVFFHLDRWSLPDKWLKRGIEKAITEPEVNVDLFAELAQLVRRRGRESPGSSIGLYGENDLKCDLGDLVWGWFDFGC